MNVLFAILGVIVALVVILVLCYFLIPGLRQRDREGKKTRAENARDEVKSMVREDADERPIDRSQEAIMDAMEEVESRADALNLKLSQIELYYLAIESIVFPRYFR